MTRKRMYRSNNKQLKKFAVKLSTIMVEAGSLGLFGTQHSLHEAVRSVGWEIADLLKNEEINLVSITTKGKRKRSEKH